MDRRAFETVVEEALQRLPEEFRSRLDNVAVLVEDRPSTRLLRSMGIPPHDTLLGVYQGTPLPDRGPTTYANVLPDRIVLFQRPIEAMGGGPAAIRRRIADTVVHEIGHYFGLSDEEMDDAEEALDAAFGTLGRGASRQARRERDEEGEPADEEDDLDEDDLEDEDDLDDEDLDEEDDLEDEDDLDDEDLDDDDLDEEDEDLDDEEDEDLDDEEDDFEDDDLDDEDDDTQR